MLLTWTAAPLRSLKTPEVTTSSPGFTPGDDGHLVATRPFELDELLTHAAVGLPFRVLEIGDDEDRVAVRGVTDGGRRQRDHRAARAQDDFHLNEHAGPQLTFRIGEGRLHLNISGGLVHYRVKRCNTTGEHLAPEIFGGDAQVAADSHLSGCLLRHAEVHINRIERLAAEPPHCRRKGIARD